MPRFVVRAEASAGEHAALGDPHVYGDLGEAVDQWAPGLVRGLPSCGEVDVDVENLHGTRLQRGLFRV